VPRAIAAVDRVLTVALAARRPPRTGADLARCRARAL